MWLVFALDLHLHIVESRNLSQFRDPFKFQLDARQISERWCNIMIAGLASFSVTLFPMQRFESRRCHFLHWRGCDNISERFGFTLFYKVALCLCLQLNVGFSSIFIWPEFVLNLWLCVFCKFCALIFYFDKSFLGVSAKHDSCWATTFPKTRIVTLSHFQKNDLQHSILVKS